MVKPKQLMLKIVNSLVCMALLTFGSSALAGLTVTNENQYGPLPFTPTWTPAPNSLIAGVAPSSAIGNFSVERNGIPLICDVANLTAGGSLRISAVSNGSGSTNYVGCGPGGGGTFVAYKLPASTHGYNITNIAVYSGWVNDGRDGQGYTVLYSTVDNPDNFVWLTNVSSNPSGVPGGNASANRLTINDSLGVAIATNVYAVAFNFTDPAPENGWCGYAAITVQGTAAASAVSPAVLLTTSTQTGNSPYTPSFVLETPNLLFGLSPITANGNFNNENCTGLSTLTDGSIGISGNNSTMASCGAGGGNVLVYELTNSVNGSDVTNIVVYSGWANNGRHAQYYDLSYSTVSSPSTFVPITRVFYLPEGLNNAPACRVAVSTPTGAALAKNVSRIKFDFNSPPYASQFNNAWQGYSEIVVQGTDSAAPPLPPSPLLTQDTLPAFAETVVGDQVVFTVVFKDSPSANLQWRQITSGQLTNNVNTGVVNVTNNGVVTSTLTLNNVQLTDSGSYQVMALNATNGAAIPTYSTATTLVVANAPAARDNVNVTVNYAGQAYSDTNYFPWTVDTSNDLILGARQSDTPVTYGFGSGDFAGGNTCNGAVRILSDGIVGSFTSASSKMLFDAGGTVNSSMGSYVIYNLDTSVGAQGFDLTNITVFGGWPNGDHNAQSYQILYSTVSAPGSFVPLATAAYNPTNANGLPWVTRTKLIPAAGAALAHNVIAVQISWNTQPGPKGNPIGWDAYSEIVIQGMPSTGIRPSLTQDVNPNTAKDVVGSQIVITAAFENYTSLQWQCNGTNIPGATSSTLTLNNLQLTNTGAYTLVAGNSAGTVSSRSCMITVNPPPARTNNIVVSIAEQTAPSTLPFTPTWNASALASSLIYNVQPNVSYPVGLSNWTTPNGNGENADGPVVLTDGSFGGIDYVNQTLPGFTCIGDNATAGNLVIYPLTGSANGYTITNITTYGGWSNDGRDSQAYTVYYATAASPNNFVSLASVSNSPVNAIGYSVSRATITPAAGALASNVVALMFDMRSPHGENGYEGYSELSVFGLPSVNPDPSLVVTAADLNTDAPDWVVETNSLIEHQLPSSSTGTFAGGIFGPSTEGLPALTDGTFGPFASVSGLGSTNFATCGGDYGAGSYLTYTCTNGSWNITNIVVYSGWGDYNRGGQFYNITYSTLSAPTTFVPLVSVNYDPLVLLSSSSPTGPCANRVAIARANGVALATNVHAITFDFTPQKSYLDYGFSGYAEIVLLGANVPSAVPPTAPTIASSHYVGGNLIVTGTGGTPGAGYTWLVTTNLSAPILWTTNSTGTLDGLGAFSNFIPVNASQQKSFFRLRMP